MSRLPFALLLLSSLALARPWQGITPGASSEFDVVGKLGEPTRRVSAGGQTVLLYSGLQAIKGTLQVQVKCDLASKAVQRIDVYPAPVITAEDIEGSYGKACGGTAPAGDCYTRKETAQKKPYFLYAKMGLAIFFQDDGKTVASFAFLPPQR